MLLNNKVPGLPEWPPIQLIQERNEYVVGGPNLSYPRYDTARKTIVLLFIGGLLLAFVLGCGLSPVLGGILAVLCFAFLPFLAVFSLMKFFCEKVFSGNDQVYFTSNQIIVNGQSFENVPGISIQFRTQGTPLSDKQIQRNNELHRQGKLPESRAYDYKFRKVEMIYGARIVFITSVADEVRANQFAVALQIAHDLSTSQLAKQTGRSATKGNPREDVLPE